MGCSIVTDSLKDLAEVTPVALEHAKELGLAEPGDEVIITAGIPFAQKGNTNIIHIAQVK